MAILVLKAQSSFFSQIPSATAQRRVIILSFNSWETTTLLGQRGSRILLVSKFQGLFKTH